MGSFLQKLLTNPEDFKFYTGNQKGAISPNNQNPRTIPFGRDKVGGKDSNQPYGLKKYPVGIKGMINDFADTYEDVFGSNGLVTDSINNDIIIRGGTLAPLKALRDTLRLTNFFTDLKNPKGLLFLVKQNLLSRIGTKTEASKGLGYAGGSLNEGAYTPLSTIGQALIGFAGGHLKKQGLEPFANINKYQDVIAENQINRGNSFDSSDNRLTSLYTYTINGGSNDTLFNSVKNYLLIPKLNPSTLIEYGGGPGSALGIGTTSIKYATKNNGANKLTVFDNSTSSNLLNAKGARYKTWDYSKISSQLPNLNGDINEDFRTTMGVDSSGGASTFVSFSPDYKANNIETKFGLGNPGSRYRNRSSYTSGSDGGRALDKVNASYIYKTEVSTKSIDVLYKTNEEFVDIIPFIISILNNDNQEATNPGTYRKNMHFRAFIDSFSDSYDADWSSISYMGRAEKLYKYKGFGRKISMAFTVVAQSREEITAMYDKLNFLASSLAPEYLDSLSSGYMAGNIAYITLGEYIYDQPGIINSLTFDIPEESPWEIGIDDAGNRLAVKDVRQVPHMIKVTGFNFTPIHKFRPEKQTFLNDILGTDSTRLLGTGIQRYVDQRRPESTNYDEEALKKYKSEAEKEKLRKLADVERERIQKQAENNAAVARLSPKPKPTTSGINLNPLSSQNILTSGK